MPNWLEGTFRARGEKENVNNFLLNAITPVSFLGNDLKIEKEIDDDGYANYFSIDKEGERKFYDGSAHLNGTRRQFLEIDDGSIWTQEKANKEIQFACRFKAAWSLDIEGLVKLAKEFNIDIRVNGFECGMEFTELLEVNRGGSIKTDSTISYDDYLWLCDMPLLGG